MERKEAHAGWLVGGATIVGCSRNDRCGSTERVNGLNECMGMHAGE